jgi:large subunit ribosomal protein L5
MTRLKELYNNEIKKNLKEKLGSKNYMAVPKLKKIAINMGVG